MMLKNLCMVYILLLASASTGICQRGREGISPNIILIIADDLGYGDLGVYGCRDIRTPQLDRLAEEGIRLTQGYVSAPYCAPSRAGLMTGRYQQRHGFYNNPPYRPNNLSMGLDPGEETLAEVMNRAGYRTAAFGKWHLGAAAPFHPNNRGFDEFCGFLGGGHNYFPARYPEIRARLADSRHPSVNGPEIYQYATPLEYSGADLAPQEGYLTDILTDYAIDFVNRYTERPFFIYLAYNAPHVPLQAPEEDIALYAHTRDPKRRVYAAMVTNLDSNVGRLLDHLEEKGLRENTLVVFISDNGGQELEGGDNGVLRGRKGQTWEGGIRVPFILCWPDGLPAGQVLETPISTMDFLPTFASLAGTGPAGKPLDGKNILPWLLGEAEGRPHAQLFWENEEWIGFRAGDWKLVRENEEGPWHLSDLSNDVAEEDNQAAGQGNRMRSMESVFMDWYGSLAPRRWEDPGRN
jgi:arylsulfatase A-like enzyme